MKKNISDWHSFDARILGCYEAELIENDLRERYTEDEFKEMTGLALYVIDKTLGDEPNSNVIINGNEDFIKIYNLTVSDLITKGYMYLMERCEDE